MKLEADSYKLPDKSPTGQDLIFILETRSKEKKASSSDS